MGEENTKGIPPDEWEEMLNFEAPASANYRTKQTYLEVVKGETVQRAESTVSGQLESGTKKRVEPRRSARQGRLAKNSPGASKKTKNRQRRMKRKMDKLRKRLDHQAHGGVNFRLIFPHLRKIWDHKSKLSHKEREIRAAAEELEMEPGEVLGLYGRYENAVSLLVRSSLFASSEQDSSTSIRLVEEDECFQPDVVQKLVERAYEYLRTGDEKNMAQRLQDVGVPIRLVREWYVRYGPSLLSRPEADLYLDHFPPDHGY